MGPTWPWFVSDTLGPNVSPLAARDDLSTSY